MNVNTRQASLLLTVVFALGCGHSDETKPGTTGSAIKDASKDAAQTAKDVGAKVGEDVKQALQSLEDFAKSAAADVAAGGEAMAAKFKAKMPDVEKLVETTKSKLAAGGEEAKQAGADLDAKLAVLKTKLDALAQNAAAATKEMKDDVVAAFNDVVGALKTQWAKLG